MAETHKQRQQRWADLRESIAAEMLKLHPELQLDRHQYGIDVLHYVVHFHDAIQVGVRKKGINTTAFNTDGLFLTEAAAIAAITEHLAEAQAKFEKCLEALNQLKETLGFDVSYSIEGDTHGIEDHPNISFTVNNFDFTFTIDHQ